MAGHAIHPSPRVYPALVNKALLTAGAVVTAPTLLVAPMAMAMAGAHGAESACKRRRGW